jgi:hypothetical protein
LSRHCARPVAPARLVNPLAMFCCQERPQAESTFSGRRFGRLRRGRYSIITLLMTATGRPGDE